MNKIWQAIYVNSRAEKKVCEALTRKDILAYAPVIKSMRQWSDRKKLVELPLIKGYVFISTQSNTDYEKILQTKGVVSFVKSDGKIATIREEEINRLRQLV